jgi:hypothetical protein
MRCSDVTVHNLAKLTLMWPPVALEVVLNQLRKRPRQMSASFNPSPPVCAICFDSLSTTPILNAAGSPFFEPPSRSFCRN